MRDLKSLMHHLGYVFKNEHLLSMAMTHRSMGNHNNERLEFLGDAILNFVIGAALFDRFPQEKEGVLTRLRAQLVKGETVAEVAKELKLGDYLRLGMGELKSGGHQRVSILSDALEAIIGAIYIDSDISVCMSRVLSWYHTRLEAMVNTECLLFKDPKTILQEWLQAKQCPLPQYTVLSIEGDPQNPIYKVACRVTVLKDPIEAVAHTRRQAEQLAAECILKVLHV